MNILKILGKVGAIALAGAGLVVAGKSEFGKDLKLPKLDDIDENSMRLEPIDEAPKPFEETEEDIFCEGIAEETEEDKTE